MDITNDIAENGALSSEGRVETSSVEREGTGLAEDESPEDSQLTGNDILPSNSPMLLIVLNMAPLLTHQLTRTACDV